MIKEVVPNFLEILTLISGIAALLVILIMIYSKVSGRDNFPWLFRFFREDYFILGLVVSLTATLGSLFYSDIMGFNPCILCWYQRIFMYPQVILFAVALWKKDRKVVRYSLTFSIIGALLAAYHYLGQISVIKGLPCEAVGYSSSCAETFFLAYNYITIPMMSLTAFVLLIILGINFLKR